MGFRGAGLCNWLQGGSSAFVAAERTDQSRFWVLRSGQHDNRSHKKLSASGALPGRDIPFAETATMNAIAEMQWRSPVHSPPTRLRE